MTMTDTVADMITRIRNGNMINKNHILIPQSRLREEVTKILKEEGLVKDYEVIEEDGRRYLKVFLLYYSENRKAIREIKKISKPGSRVYVDRNKIPVIKGGAGIAVISTSKGIMSNRKAKEQGLGGELLFHVW